MKMGLGPLLALALSAVAAPCAGQQVPRPTGTVLEVRATDARLVAPLDGEIDELRTDGSRVAPAIVLARPRRPWWAIPLVATAAGAALYELARGDECENTDCIIHIPPPLTGAVLGLVVGAGIEITLRLSGS